MVKATDYQLIVGQLSKLGIDGILRRCIPKYEKDDIIRKAHEGTIGVYYVGKVITNKIMHAGLWWPTIFRDTKKCYDICDVF